MKLRIVVMAVLCPLWMLAQQVKIGEQLPVTMVKPITGYPEPVSLPVKGKAVLLDFFATWCGACLGELLHLDSLQKQYKESLQVFIICYEPEETIRKFLQRHKKAGAVSLPFVTDDSILHQYFPHRLLPHNIWIGKDGRIAAITNASQVTKKHLDALVAGTPLRLPLKQDAMDFDRRKPLLENGNGGTEEQVLTRSMVSRYLEGVPVVSGSVKDEAAGMKRIYHTNRSLPGLYAIATNNAFRNRVTIETADSSRFFPGDRNVQEWAAGNCYSYELTVPATATNERINKLMIKDLDACFGLHSRKEQRRVTCYVLTVDDPSRLKQAGVVKPADGFVLFHKRPVSAIVDALNMQSPLRTTPILVDETGYKEPVSIKLPQNASIPQLKMAFKSYGIILSETTRVLDVFVITEK